MHPFERKKIVNKGKKERESVCVEFTYDQLHITLVELSEGFDESEECGKSEATIAQSSGAKDPRVGFTYGGALGCTGERVVEEMSRLPHEQHLDDLFAAIRVDFCTSSVSTLTKQHRDALNSAMSICS